MDPAAATRHDILAATVRATFGYDEDSHHHPRQSRRSDIQGRQSQAEAHPQGGSNRLLLALNGTGVCAAGCPLPNVKHPRRHISVKQGGETIRRSVGCTSPALALLDLLQHVVASPVAAFCSGVSEQLACKASWR